MSPFGHVFAESVLTKDMMLQILTKGRHGGKFGVEANTSDFVDEFEPRRVDH